jgi:hypothetical protein
MQIRLLIGVLALLATDVRAAQMILNEFNAVSATSYLNGGTAGADEDGELAADPAFGRVLGNGGDWFELVVVADHLDARGWTLEICDDGVCNEELVLSQSAIWSDLRAGTIISVAEDVATDTSYDPPNGDWTIRVQAIDGGSAAFITPNSFPVSNDDWQITIRDASDALVFGPAGEGIAADPESGCNPPPVGVNGREVFKLETAPSALVDRCSSLYNDGKSSSFGAPNVWGGGSIVQDLSALRLGLPIPDRDTDGIADDGDRSGIAGDAPCSGGASAGCDDNCPGEANASQADAGGVGAGGANGIGDACECGDVDDDGDVDAADRQHLREKLAAQLADVDAPDKCGVVNDGTCTVADAAVTKRAVDGLAPDVEPVCPAAALPSDPEALWYDPDRLLEIEVTMQKADWDVMRNQVRDLFAMFVPQTCGDAVWPDPYTFFPADVVVEGQPLVDVGIRKKGFVGSASTTKPSLKLDFGEFVSGQRLEGLDRLTLNNSVQDPSFVKTCLAYQFMAAAGVPAPRCNFARVTVHTLNGAVVETPINGLLYVNVESIKEPFLGRAFGDQTGRLYEGTLSDFWLKGGVPSATNEPWRNTIEPKDDAAAEDWTEVDALTAALVNPGYSDAQRRAEIETVLDLDAYLTFWAAEGMTGHWDGYADDQNNFYFYVNPADGKIHFIPWGADDTFGRGNTLSNRTGDPVHCQAIVPRSALARRLYAMPDVRALFLAKLQQQLDTVWNPTAQLAEVDRMQALIEPVTGSLTTALAPIRTWINDHRVRVQAEINAPPAGFTVQPEHFCLFD